MSHDAVARAARHFEGILRDQLARAQAMKKAPAPIDFAALHPIRVGLCYGDGIGPILSRETRRVLEHLLAGEIRLGKVELRDIEGLTLENRVRRLQAIPDDVLAELEACHVILKAPTTTPEKGDGLPNIESANVAMRRHLDLFANVRPVRIPREGIDWVFFRENTEGAYLLGSQGLMVTEDLALDFTAATRAGCERILRMAFEHARRHGIDTVTVVTKANVIKTTDGLFLEAADRIGRDYPGIRWDGWYIDIMTAKLLDPKRRRQFRVLVMPNLYGDILTDEAAELQGGVGTAGSANIGHRHAMFEAIHGSAPRMVREGRGEYADPSSLIRAAAMMLNHMGFAAPARRLDQALDLCCQLERRVVVTGRPDGATAGQLCDHLLATLADPELPARWEALGG